MISDTSFYMALGVINSPAELTAMRARAAADRRAVESIFAEWGECERIHTPLATRLHAEVYRNNIYFAGLMEVNTGSLFFGRMRYLMFARRDGAPVPSWCERQRVKATLCGSESAAIEVYPPGSREMDAAHCYHLWVMSPTAAAAFPLDVGRLGQMLAARAPS